MGNNKTEAVERFAEWFYERLWRSELLSFTPEYVPWCNLGIDEKAAFLKFIEDILSQTSLVLAALGAADNDIENWGAQIRKNLDICNKV